MLCNRPLVCSMAPTQERQHPRMGNCSLKTAPTLSAPCQNGYVLVQAQYTTARHSVRRGMTAYVIQIRRCRNT